MTIFNKFLVAMLRVAEDAVGNGCMLWYAVVAPMAYIKKVN
jgi:hypothetical protein